MATSSILTNVVIEDPKKAEAFVDALEKSSQIQYGNLLHRLFQY